MELKTKYEVFGLSLHQTCAICSAPLRTQYLNYPGYQEASLYDILQCDRCNTSTVGPCHVDEQLYDVIYQHARSIVGYSRYVSYAEGVLTVADPLAYLANTEDVYWGVKRLIDSGAAKTDGKILEVGSGYGYLTYALKKSGLDVSGIELSKNAVDSATAFYGKLYEHGDVSELIDRQPGSFASVIMTEVIEHVEQPVELIGSCLKLLRKGGTLILTTPNKTFYPDKAVWRTEAPPIHLWWFSENSLREVAKQYGARIQFVDFSEFNRRHGIPPTFGSKFITSGPVLASDGTPLPFPESDVGKTNTLLRVIKPMLRPAARFAKELIASVNGQLHRRSTICVAIEKM
jgi:2-polyprenyl-3-methyl-5-hydroxy-6-metoxy-1,4-benzoquinol methylase